ncbi:hypothetical protein [Actinoplanes sp. L3-i22]|uniref:hypothetical protein n=1 Tax=Actinoplanes sp. L3-i22 TaxID=2836373 RepID=UPI001C759829|nr:hypothetical protein [Actinoplanes sp. L3-i22]BCY09077.1 hypothetical protein L3i22_041650 [Actinoplanes sp. L3-i22]
MPQSSSEPTVAELLAGLRSAEALQSLLTEYDLTEDDVLAQARRLSRELAEALDARGGR